MSAPGLADRELLRPSTVAEAVAELSRLGSDGAPLAGATWIMRAHLRGEHRRSRYVALAGIEELHRVEQGGPVVFGALVTHSELARLATDAGPLGAVAEAARRSAFPAVRNVATVGGNICADPFPEADLVPALLAAAADVELAGPQGDRTLPLSSYLAERADRPPGELVCRVRVPAPAGRRAWFERLTVRAGGEYAVASVALSVDLDDEGCVLDARLAVGSVAATPLRSAAAERVLAGSALDDAVAAEAGRAAAEEIEPRDDPGAPGWYRLAVLPALVRRAAARIAAHEEAAAA